MKRSPLMFLRELEQERKNLNQKSPLATIARLNREAEIRELRDKLLDHLRERRPMKQKHGTLIIAAKCKNGLTMGTDTKVVRGTEAEYSNKIFDLDLGGKDTKVLFAAEGLTGIRDDFFLLLGHEIRKRRGVDTLYEVKVIVEDIIAELTSRYSERVRQLSPIGVLLGGLDGITIGNATLYYIHSEGYGELVSFYCTGHGGPYAYGLAKFLCGPQLICGLTMEEVARRVAFAIQWVSDEVDSTVGGRPQIMMMKDGSAKPELLSNSVIEEEAKRVKDTRDNFAKVLGFAVNTTK